MNLAISTQVGRLYQHLVKPPRLQINIGKIVFFLSVSTIAKITNLYFETLTSYRFPFSLIHGAPTLFTIALLSATLGYHVEVDIVVWIKSLFVSNAVSFREPQAVKSKKPNVFSKAKKKYLVKNKEYLLSFDKCLVSNVYQVFVIQSVDIRLKDLITRCITCVGSACEVDVVLALADYYEQTKLLAVISIQHGYTVHTFPVDLQAMECVNQGPMTNTPSSSVLEFMATMEQALVIGGSEWTISEQVATVSPNLTEGNIGLTDNQRDAAQLFTRRTRVQLWDALVGKLDKSSNSHLACQYAAKR